VELAVLRIRRRLAFLTPARFNLAATARTNSGSVVTSQNDPTCRDTFRIKVGNFSRVDGAIQREILDGYLDRLFNFGSYQSYVRAGIRGFRR
jgi:hypothetical protein